MDQPEWLSSDAVFSGGETGRKWYRWFAKNFYYGFTATRIDEPSPTLTVPLPMLEHVGVRGLDPAIRFWTPEWPGKGWEWIIESITQRDGQTFFQVALPFGDEQVQMWRLVPISEEQFKQLWESGWYEWMV